MIDDPLIQWAGDVLTIGAGVYLGVVAFVVSRVIALRMVKRGAPPRPIEKAAK